MKVNVGYRSKACERHTGMDAFVSLGSNMGNAGAYLDRALEALAALPRVHLHALSPRYLTQPQGVRDQPWFTNQVAHLACAPPYTAGGLLAALLDVEARLGRVRHSDALLRYAPRCIDLDLLLFGDEHSDDPVCTLPHPRLVERAFVLVPLRDIAPKSHVAHGVTPEQALEKLVYSVQSEKIFQ